MCIYVHQVKIHMHIRMFVYILHHTDGLCVCVCTPPPHCILCDYDYNYGIH